MSTRAEARGRTRERVIASANACFREDGFAATTVRRIADRADVSIGTVMGVGDKQSLLIEVFDRGIAEIHARSPRPAADPDRAASDDAGAGALVALVRPFVDLFVADPALSRRYAAVLIAGEHRSEVFGGLAERLLDEFGAVLARSGRTPVDAVAGARAAYHLYLGVLFSASAQGGRTLSADTLCDELRGGFAVLLEMGRAS